MATAIVARPALFSRSSFVSRALAGTTLRRFSSTLFARHSKVSSPKPTRELSYGRMPSRDASPTSSKPKVKPRKPKSGAAPPLEKRGKLENDEKACMPDDAEIERCIRALEMNVARHNAAKEAKVTEKVEKEKRRLEKIEHDRNAFSVERRNFKRYSDDGSETEVNGNQNLDHRDKPNQASSSSTNDKKDSSRTNNESDEPQPGLFWFETSAGFCVMGAMMMLIASNEERISRKWRMEKRVHEDTRMKLLSEGFRKPGNEYEKPGN